MAWGYSSMTLDIFVFHSVCLLKDLRGFGVVFASSVFNSFKDY